MTYFNKKEGSINKVEKMDADSGNDMKKVNKIEYENMRNTTS